MKSQSFDFTAAFISASFGLVAAYALAKLLRSKNDDDDYSRA